MDVPVRLQATLRRVVREGRIVHLTHGRCVDGLTAAALVRRAWPGTWSFRIQHDELPVHLAALAAVLAKEPLSVRARLIVTDLGVQEGDRDRVMDLLLTLRPRCFAVWLDHHAPQWPVDEEARLAKRTVHHRIDRSLTESGASLTLAFLQEAQDHGFPPPENPLDGAALAHAVDRVRARDTWSDPDDEGTRFMLVARRLRDEDYVRLFAAEQFEALRILGEEELRRHRHETAQALGRVEKATNEVAVLFGPGPLSDTAAALWGSDPDARVLLHFRPHGALGIRSRPDTPLAADLAQAFGGGGHAHAAAARLVKDTRLRTWWLHRRRLRHRKVRRAVRRARRVVSRA